MYLQNKFHWCNIGSKYVSLLDCSSEILISNPTGTRIHENDITRQHHILELKCPSNHYLRPLSDKSKLNRPILSFINTSMKAKMKVQDTRVRSIKKTFCRQCILSKIKQKSRISFSGYPSYTFSSLECFICLLEYILYPPLKNIWWNKIHILN